MPPTLSISGVKGPGAKALEIDPPPGMHQAGVVFQGSSTVGLLLAVRPAVEKVYAVYIGFVRVANVGVVEEERLVVTVVGGLNEGTELAVDLTSVKDTCVLDHDIVVGL